MTQRLLIVTCILLCSVWTNAQTTGFKQTQKSFEFGWFSGISNYSGELRQLRFEVQKSEFATGLFFRRNFSDNFSYKTHVYYGKISGSDSDYQSLNIHQRNLSFETEIVEWAHLMEFSFMNFGTRTERIAAPYIFGGVSGFYFNPKANYQGEWVELQPLGTEGQGRPGYGEKYERVQVAIPFGLGFNVKVGDQKDVVIGFEVGFHKTFTDYLDDVGGVYPDQKVFGADNLARQMSYRGAELPNRTIDDFPTGQARGNGDHFDSFFFGGISISKQFSPNKGNKRSKKSKGKQLIL